MMWIWLGTVAAATAFAAPVAASDYQQLTQVFADWRRLQAGEIREGASDFSAPALARQSAGLKRLQSRLAAIDTTDWTTAQKVDLQLVRAEMNGLDFDLRV